MKKMLFVLMLGITCAKAQSDTTFNWLIGKWEAPTSGGKFFEEWQAGVQQLKGNGGEIVRGDTVFREILVLIKKKGKWSYIADVTSADKKQEPTEFPMAKVSKRTYVFENKEHDFPQQIIYEYLDKDHFKARVGGMIKGNYREDVYEMKRVK